MPRILFLFIVASLLSSCASAFNREWKAAIKAGPQPGIRGAWQGTWKSDVNGHHGRLRCVIGPAKNAQGDHGFHYHATWAGILSGAYRADHRATPAPAKDGHTFQGRHQMPGWAGGMYNYKGTVRGDDFIASYECALDKGTFQMKRVK